MTPHISEYPLHPLATVFPSMPEAEYSDLRQSVCSFGLREPIAVWQGQIIDGRHRFQACQDEGVSPVFNILPEETDPYAFVEDANILRRHLDPDQRVAFKLEIRNLRERGRSIKDSDNGIGNHNTTLVPGKVTYQEREEIATAVDTTARQVEKVAIAQRRAPAPVWDAIKGGEVKASDALRVIDAPVAVQEQALEEVKQGQARSLAGAVNKIQREVMAQPPPLAGNYLSDCGH